MDGHGITHLDKYKKSKQIQEYIEYRLSVPLAGSGLAANIFVPQKPKSCRY